MRIMNIEAARLAILLLGVGLLLPACHGGGGVVVPTPPPILSDESGANVANLYCFLDPNDNAFACLIMTSGCPKMPGLAEEKAFFPANNRYRFGIENTGDVAPDLGFEVTFTDYQGPTTPQSATVNMLDLAAPATPLLTFTAPTTLSVADDPNPNPFVVTNDPGSNISFFAGQTDDPFFFDVPASLQFRNSLEADVLAGNPPPLGDPDVFLRERDTFAGYNILSIALRVPVAALVGTGGPTIGVSAYTDRLFEGTADSFFQVDRQGFPVINVVLLDPPRRRDYNRATPEDDANLTFSPDILNRLGELGTNPANTGILTNLFITQGDQMRLDTTLPNTGTQGGTNAAAAFPNGRRLADNAPDALVNIISNQLFVAAGGGPGSGGAGANIGNEVNGVPDIDLVPANDQPFQNAFPFLALPNQPLFPGDTNGDGITDSQAAVVPEDGTRN